MVQRPVIYDIRVNDRLWKDAWVVSTNTAYTQTAYDLQTATWHSWTGTGDHWYITDEEITRANRIGDAGGAYTYNYTYNHPVQEQMWRRWEITERETREQEQARLDRQQQLREAESRRRLEEEARWAALEAERAQAHERGMELLQMIMSAEERLMLLNTGRITVRGSEGRLYEIDTGRGGVHGNIYEVDEHGCKLANLCVAPAMRVDSGVLPLSDGYVGQYLAVKHDEAGLRARANFSYRRECTRPEVPILNAA